jgi:hypothetical protein
VGPGSRRRDPGRAVADVRLRRHAGRLTGHGEHRSRRTPTGTCSPTRRTLGRGAVDDALASAPADQGRNTSALWLRIGRSRPGRRASRPCRPVLGPWPGRPGPTPGNDA